MKNIIATVAFSAISWYASAQETKPIPVNAVLNHVNVNFGYGAELTHSAKTQLQKGVQEIELNNVSTLLDQNTIQVTCPENVTLLSYRFNVKTETTNITNPILPKMEDSIKQLNKQINAVNNDYFITEEQLKKTSALVEVYTNSGNKNINGAEVIKLIDFYSNKIQVYRATLYAQKIKKEEYQEQINEIRKRMDEARATGNKYLSKTIGQLILQVMANQAGNADFEATYFTQRAGWVPTYEMRMKTIDNSFKLAWKASVSQTTGIDWKQAKLTLSTNNPNLSTTAPLLNAWYLQQYVPRVYNDMLRGRQAAVNSVQSLNEVVVVGYENAKKISAKEEDMSDVSAYTNVAESRLYTSFEIDLPYDIPCDGKSYSVAIKEEDIKAGYKHYSVPKLDRDAFLMAELSDWENLDLLPGEANIIMDGKYIGKSFIDPNAVTDTLTFSLGRDKRITTKRQLVKESSKSKVKGDTKTETFTYELTVKNNKKQVVNLLLKDQYPLSRDKDITVTLDDGANAEVNADLGILNWKLELQPGESKKIRFSYSVKYPKDKVIGNLRQ